MIFLLLFLPACTSTNDLERVNREQTTTIKSLNHEIMRLNQELDQMIQSRDDLSRAKTEFEQSMQGEMADGNLSVAMEDRGLVVTVLDRVLFDSGKAELKESSQSTLDKVAEVLQSKVKGHMIYVEGHTDSVPIFSSRWRSNWELSTARATQVIHYFVDTKGLAPERLAATGYGEFHPVADNGSDEGRMKNRRVDIVVSPKKIGNA